MSVSTKFENFCENIRISDSDNQKIINRYHQITKRINLDYYNSDSDVNHSLYIGSYGRDTEIFTSDIQKSLKTEEEQTFSEKEIDVMLPSSIRRETREFKEK